jgi:hypothetical protein
MANREKGESTLQIGDTAYTLVLNLHAWALAQDALTKYTRGKKGERVPSVPPVEEIMALLQRQHVKSAIAVFWAALQKHHPDIETLEQATELMSLSGGAAGQAMLEAMGVSVADTRDVQEIAGAANPPEAQARSGKKRGDGTGVTSISPLDKSA